MADTRITPGSRVLIHNGPSVTTEQGVVESIEHWYAFGDTEDHPIVCVVRDGQTNPERYDPAQLELAGEGEGHR